MLELVLANLQVRPIRTLISVVGVALGVILVVLFTGLARGMTQDMAKRATNWKAEIVFARSGGMELNSSYMNLSIRHTFPNYRLGCKRYTHAEWSEFNDSEIAAMDSRATDFWNKWKLPLLAMCKQHAEEA